MLQLALRSLRERATGTRADIVSRIENFLDRRVLETAPLIGAGDMHRRIRLPVPRGIPIPSRVKQSLGMRNPWHPATDTSLLMSVVFDFSLDSYASEPLASKSVTGLHDDRELIDFLILVRQSARTQNKRPLGDLKRLGLG